MRVNGVILPSEIVSVEWPGSQLGQQSVGKKIYLEYQIRELRKLAKNPIVIIGSEGDDLLRALPLLGERNMVFSKHSADNQLEHIKAGLEGAGTCAFYLPLQVPAPAPLVWSELEKTLAQLPYQSDVHILQPVISDKSGYPFLITPSGKEFLLDCEWRGDVLNSPDIKIQNVKVNSETALQFLKNQKDFNEWKSLYTA